MDRFSLVHPPFTLVPAQPVRVVLNASLDCLKRASSPRTNPNGVLGCPVSFHAVKLLWHVRTFGNGVTSLATDDCHCLGADFLGGRRS